MSNNNHQIVPEQGTCMCSCNYYFWMSMSVSILSFLAFPVIQFVYGINLRNNNTSIEGIFVTVADWLLADGLISVPTGIMAMVIIKNSDTVPNLIKIIFNMCIAFLFCWTILGSIMLFVRVPIIIHGLAVIYNYIMLTSYIAYFITSVKYKDHILPSINVNDPHDQHDHHEFTSA